MSPLTAHGTRSVRRAAGLSLGAGTGLGILIALVESAGGCTAASLALVCWVLVAAGIGGTTLASRGIGWGWLLLASLQPLWIAYAVITGQYGFVLSAAAYGVGQLHGFLRSRPAPALSNRTAAGPGLDPGRGKC